MMAAALVFSWRHGDGLPTDLRQRFHWLLPVLGVNLLLGFLPFLDGYAHVGGLIGGGVAAVFLRERIVTRHKPAWAVSLAIATACTLSLFWAMIGVAGEWD